MIKILYHGSNVVVNEPLVSSSRKNLDFGPGFYTTSDFNQAVSWAKRKSKIENSKEAFVSYYELDTEKLKNFSDYINLNIETPNFVLELKDWVSGLNNKNGDDKTIFICKIKGR